MMITSTVTPQVISETLSTADYNRERLHPDLKDFYYPHLADVKLFLSEYSQGSFESVLDYGCGGSPYRLLFNALRYTRADYVACKGVDLLIGADGRLALLDSLYDAVLSTQVLEHVFSPQVYLQEAFRVLRPGGKLILTTHGIWEDHGCPYDFRRWTADGLRRELMEAGFTVTRAVKLTTGPRAILFLLSQIYDHLWHSRRELLGWAWWLLRRSSFGSPERRHRWMNDRFGEFRMVSDRSEGHRIYLALGIEGTKA